MKQFAAWATFSLALAGHACAAPPEPEGFRTDNYRAPTPLTLSGAKVLTTSDARALWEAKAAAFVDVLPQAPRPKSLPKDVFWRERPRDDIPGSMWLPDTGYGELAQPMRVYFESGLKRLGDKTLVFYCQRNCWMSWNAAKRAIALGFKEVDWYPDGVDGWREAGFPLESRNPEPRPP